VSFPCVTATMCSTPTVSERGVVCFCAVRPAPASRRLSAVVAREVVGEFTVIYVEAKAGAQLLTAVVEEAQRLGDPVLLVLEDVDLWCRDRKADGAGLSELLQAMDIKADARILTLAASLSAASAWVDALQACRAYPRPPSRLRANIARSVGNRR
jgi:hypothetical protein